MESTTKDLAKLWKSNLPGLFKEVVEHNPSCDIFRQPFAITKAILSDIAERAIELGDNKLIAHCMRLSLLSVSDPKDKDFNPELVNKFISENLS